MSVHEFNQKLIEAGTPRGASHWNLGLVFHWFGGEALSETQQAKLADFYTSSSDTGVLVVDLEAAEFTPHLTVNLDIETTDSDIDPSQERAYSIEEHDTLKQEAAVSKGITGSLGGFAIIGVSLDTIELQGAFLTSTKNLSLDIPVSQAVNIPENDIEPMANDVLIDEVEKFTALRKLIESRA